MLLPISLLTTCAAILDVSVVWRCFGSFLPLHFLLLLCKQTCAQLCMSNLQESCCGRQERYGKQTSPDTPAQHNSYQKTFGAFAIEAE